MFGNALHACPDDLWHEQLCIVGRREMSFAELLLYNMRHTQEHGAQLSLFLGQQRGLAAGWVAKAQSETSMN